jgi:hypothetical protein
MLVWDSVNRVKYSHFTDRVAQLTARHASLIDNIEKIKNGDLITN